MNPNAPTPLATLVTDTWRSAFGSPRLPTASDCTEIEWTVTQQHGSTYTGEFSATCAAGVQLDGTATLPGAASCAFTLTGTVRLKDEATRVDYSGNTCLGSISGTELLELD